MKTSYILSDYDVIRIVENLSLAEKFKMRKVSKQFRDCVDRALKSQKVLRLSIERSDSNRVSLSGEEWDYFKPDLEINDRSQALGRNQMKKRLEPLLNRFKTLKRLILRHNTTNIWFFEWLNRLFPDLKSVEIVFVLEDVWDNNKLLAFKSVFGPKCEKVVTDNMSNIQLNLLIRSGLLYMPSIRSIELSFDSSVEPKEPLIQIFRNITTNITSLTITECKIAANRRVWQSLVSSNAKSIQELRIIETFGVRTNGSQCLESICEHLLQIKCLQFYCKTLPSFGSLQSATNLEDLKIDLTDILQTLNHNKIFRPIVRNPLIAFPTNDSFVLTKLRRISIVNPGIDSDFCENMEKAFPIIEYVYLKKFEIYCRCVDVTQVCLKCYKEFLTVCAKVYERKLVSKKMSSIDLRYSTGNESKTVLLSIMETFVETKHSFNIEIKRNENIRLLSDVIMCSQKTELLSHLVLSLVLESVIQMALRKPEIKLCFKVGILYSEKVKSFRHSFPSNLKIVIIGNGNSLKSEKRDENELCIHFDETSKNFVVKLGSNTSISKRIKISMDPKYFVPKF